MNAQPGGAKSIEVALRVIESFRARGTSPFVTGAGRLFLVVSVTVVASDLLTKVLLTTLGPGEDFFWGWGHTFLDTLITVGLLFPMIYYRIFRPLEHYILENRKSQAELERANERLAHALAELREIQARVIQQERLSALGEMASGIAHDFNNTLTPILGYSELLVNFPDTLADREKTMNSLRLIHTAAKDAGEVVHRLRQFYRKNPEEEKLTMLDLNELLRAVISLTQPKWQEETHSRGIEIRVESIFAPLPPILGNSGELREAFVNLILNAVDAMPAGGKLTLCTRREGERVLVEIQDEGTGMREDVRQRCFDPFFTTKGEEGTGLGLSVVHGVVTRHGGTIEIESKWGRGTTFLLSFPAAEARASEVPEPEQPLSCELHILLVDDDPAVREVIEHYLIEDGHRVEVAGNGREGFERFRRAWFDLVITDRAMPEMNGDHLAALVKQIAPKKPVIMLTGFGDLMEHAGEKPNGIDLLLKKPVTLGTLRQALAKACACEPPTAHDPPEDPGG